MKNKLILFDWGNIVESHLTGYNVHNAWNDVFYACGYTGDENIFTRIKEYKLGAIKTDEELERVYNKLKNEFNLDKSYDEFKKIYAEIFDKIDFYKEVADYEKSLKDKCSIGILSNLLILDKERIDKQLNLSDYDYVFLSFELGTRKPDIKIFELVQKKLPFEKENILFIDDRSDNIDTAKKFGWNTFQATGLELDKIKEICENFINN